MAQDSVEKIIGRLITDDSFRQRAILSFQRTCFEEGYMLSNEEEMFLVSVLKQKAFSKKIASISELIDGNLKRRSLQMSMLSEGNINHTQEVLMWGCNERG